MSKKKITPAPEDAEEKALEAKVEKMLDPKLPDVPEESATTVKVLNDEPEVDAEASLPTKIEIVSHDDSDESQAEPDVESGEADVDDAVKESGDDESDKSDETSEPTGPPELEEANGVAEKEDEELDGEVTSETDKVDEQPEVDTEIKADDIDESEPTPEIEEDDQNQPAEEASEDSEISEKTDAIEVVDDVEASEVAPPKKPLNEATAEAELNEAVEEIAKADSDALLFEADEKKAELAVEKRPPLKAKIKAFFVAWWRNKKARYATFAVLIAMLVGLGVFPTSRYFMLNTVGVRSSSSIRVVDSSTLQPLKNVEVEIHGVKGTTDIDGLATLSNIKLGKTELVIKKRAFAELKKSVTIGWGSNPLSDERLNPVGTQYVFMVTDFVSEKPLTDVEASSGDASAVANEKGEIKLTLEQPTDEFDVQITSNGYRQETVLVQADSKEAQDIVMVAAKKHTFISRRDGTYDVYAVYADGKDEELLLKGTGSERDDIALVPHPSRDIVALVSTRSGERNPDSFLLSSLTLIDLNNPSEAKSVSISERIQVIGWQNERLVFVQIKSGTSAADPQRHQLKTHNIDQGTTAELAHANYFNDVMALNDVILYAPSSAYSNSPAALYRIKLDGSDQQIVHPAEVWSLFRTDIGQVTFTTGPDWLMYDIESTYVEKLEGQPANISSRQYVFSYDRSAAVRVDNRDGKGVLLLESASESSDDDQTIIEQNGLKNPLVWLNDTTILYRVKTESESADFVISTQGGQPKKVVDVENTAGLERWYYY